jgi:hypothetical protein
MQIKRLLAKPWPKPAPRAMSTGVLPMRRLREWGSAAAAGWAVSFSNHGTKMKSS